jgi:DivIVA domain-containing protein
MRTGLPQLDAQLAEREPPCAVDVTLLLMESTGPGQPVGGDEIRNVQFIRAAGYDASQVNDLLDRIAAELDAGRQAGPLIANLRDSALIR